MNTIDRSSSALLVMDYQPAILGRVGGEMIMTDAIVVQTFQPASAIRYGVEGFCAAGVVLAGYLWSRRRTTG